MGNTYAHTMSSENEGNQNNGFRGGARERIAKVAVKEKESKNQIDGKHILCEHAAMYARTLNKRLEDD